MNGTTKIGEITLPTAPNLNWSIGGATDIDGDGRPTSLAQRRDGPQRHLEHARRDARRRDVPPDRAGHRLGHVGLLRL
jgi:hypothetical protein